MRKIFFLLIGLLAHLVLSVSVWAVPDTINYQGKLTDSKNVPLTGTYSMQFYICDALAGGSCSWSEELLVEVNDGIYNLLLGEVTPIPSAVFGTDILYLEVRIDNGSAWEILSPRQSLSSVPFAMRAGDADTVEGQDASAFAPVSHAHDASYVNTGEANSVTSAMIVNSSVTDADVAFNYAGSPSKGGPASDVSCAGCVSQSELNFSVPGFPAQRVVVAKNGGDYTSIGAALAAISPSSSNRYVVDVMPGTYIENVDLKSFVHLRGAGREVAILQATNSGYDPLDINSLTDAAVSGLAIQGGYYGVHISNSSRVTVTENNFTDNAFGIYLYNSSNVSIAGNSISANRNHGISISSINDTEVLIIGNTITENTYEGIRATDFDLGSVLKNVICDNHRHGLFFYGSSVQLNGNTIRNNAGDGIEVSNYSDSTLSGNVVYGNGGYGLWIGTWSRPKVIHNMITANGVTSGTDIYVDATTSTTYRPTIAFNMYNTLTNAGSSVRVYNVTSAGAAAP